MKTIIILLLIISPLFLFSVPNFNATQSAKNGGTNGYYDVSETHDTNNHTSSLKCKDPSSDACSWTQRPEDVHHLEGSNGTDIYIGDLETHANIQISLDTLNGSFSSNIIVDGELWYRNISWISTDVSNYNFFISLNKSVQ